MSIYHGLHFQKSKSSYSKSDEVGISVYYYSKGEKVKWSLPIKVKIKDWKNGVDRPVMKTDSEIQMKNLKISELKNLINRTPTKLNSDSKISLPPRHRKSDGTYSSTISPYLPKSEGKNMGDFWNEEIVRTAVANQNLDIEGEHIAPLPKQIITLPILQTSEIGGLVLDPFCGSGNVGRICDVLERNFVGYDLNNYIS